MTALLRLMGWKALVLHGDPSTFDRFRWLKKHLQAGSGRTLDAGCGNGAFAFYASSIGNQAIGVCFDKPSCQTMQSRAVRVGMNNTKFIQGDLRTLDQWGDRLGKFDQIICFETIEHIQNDKKLIADLSHLLNPKGRLLLTTPYKHYKPLLGDHLASCEDGGHVRWGYTHREIKALFQEYGLEVTTESYISGFISQKLMNLMRRLSHLNLAFAWVVTFPLRLLQVFDAALTNLIQYPYLSIGVVAVKKSEQKRR